ncbi:hypothetical protein ACIRPX_20355 [Streptomyces sp. NPDC101225]|uniref:hypothetical protein n=1 Tax=Streptomyces sp. NPDC101225 TaxID=3366135 RepID=UPI003825A379
MGFADDHPIRPSGTALGTGARPSGRAGLRVAAGPSGRAAAPGRRLTPGGPR